MKKFIRFLSILDLILLNLTGFIICISVITAVVLCLNQDIPHASKEIYLTKLCWVAVISIVIYIISGIAALKLEKIEAKLAYKEFLEITKNV